MDRDPEGQLRGYDMTTLQTVPSILQVCWHCLAGRETCFQQCDKFAGQVGEGIHLHCLGLYVTPKLLCKLNKPYTKLRVAIFFLA